MPVYNGKFSITHYNDNNDFSTYLLLVHLTEKSRSLMVHWNTTTLSPFPTEIYLNEIWIAWDKWASIRCPDAYLFWLLNVQLSPSRPGHGIEVALDKSQFKKRFLSHIFAWFVPVHFQYQSARRFFLVLCRFLESRVLIAICVYYRFIPVSSLLPCGSHA